MTYFQYPIELETKIKAVSQGVAGDPVIIEVQSYLRIMGFPIGNFGPNHNGVDGHIGDATRAAVQTFQILTEAPLTEPLDPDTVTELERAMESGSTFRSIAEQAYRKAIQMLISTKETLGQFVNNVYYYGVNDETNTKVPAAVTVSQAILESNYGKNIPTDLNTGKISYNLFGIKGTGPAGSVICWTQEQTAGGVFQPVKARFRAYHNFGESIKDHSQFFYTNIKRYGNAFKTKTPAEFAKAIARDGYATDSKYAQKLIAIMNLWGVS